ncbi:hypothetical protein FRB93_000588 [Tulasnella sp. JGI-2019a]|nr:hypothetical protein FRB93_000588 [Tulasnella sp. JGI-2019a]
MSVISTLYRQLPIGYLRILTAAVRRLGIIPIQQDDVSGHPIPFFAVQGFGGGHAHHRYLTSGSTETKDYVAGIHHCISNVPIILHYRMIRSRRSV